MADAIVIDTRPPIEEDCDSYDLFVRRKNGRYQIWTGLTKEAVLKFKQNLIDHNESLTNWFVYPSGSTPLAVFN